MVESTIEILREIDEDGKYVAKHYVQLETKFKGKIIAVKHKEVVAASETIDGILKELSKKGIEPSSVLIESIPPSSLSFIL